MTPSEFKNIISGREKGVRAIAWRVFLRLAEIPYTWVVRCRNRRYDRGKSPIHAVEVPVISVGNLTLGGTGKTPMVHWLARQLRDRGVRVAVISRGYGAEKNKSNDEAMELQQRLPDVPHLENPDRVAAARCAIDELDMQVLLLDDAFQHRRIRRDLDIVLLDATEPFGFDHVFPRGTLREPLAGLRRADVVILSRADRISQEQRDAIRHRVLSIAPGIDWAEVIHAPEAFLNASGEILPLDAMKGKRVAVFCGLGNSAGFLGTLDSCGIKPVAFREFPDHHRYKKSDVKELIAWSKSLDVDAVLCTHKDLVKLDIDRLGPTPLWALTIKIQFLTGEPALTARLAAIAANDE